MNKPLLGAHVSAAGGLYKAVENGLALEAGVIQIFGASPRQWQATLPSKESVKAFQIALRESDIKAVYLHGAYLVNLASAKKDLFAKSVKNLSTHFQIANLIGAKGLVFHIGSSKEENKEEVFKRVASGMKLVLGHIKGPSKLLMENASGGGGKVGSTMDDLIKLHRLVNSKRVGFCLDTAHAFEAGIIEYSREGIRTFFDEWDKELGMDSLFVMHTNDSKTVAGSFSDRHENIGEGHIGIDGFKNLAQDKRLYGVDWVLEVPGFDGGGPDKKNLDVLESCFSV